VAENPLCETCTVAMTKVGTLQSSNATYERFRCPECHAEKSVCLGLTK